MRCQKCNFENEKDSIFCKQCGQRLNADSETENSTNKSKQNSVNEIKGCLTQSWNDITSSEKWFRKISLVGICNVVPIVNFATCGFAQKWGVDAARGKNNQLPTGIFENQSIKTGFFEWVTWLAYGFVFLLFSMIVSGTLGKIFFLGTLISIALFVFNIFYNVFVSLGAMKMAVDDKLSSSFDLKKIWNSYKKDFGSLFCTYFVPALLCTLIALAICFIIFIIFAWTELGFFIAILTNIQYAINSTSTIIQLFQMLASITVCIVLCYIVVSFISGVEKVIRYRAIGIYINRNSKDWIK